MKGEMKYEPYQDAQTSRALDGDPERRAAGRGRYGGTGGGVPRGALVGFLYMAAGVLVYALLTGQRLTAFSYLADLLLGLAAGGLTGMVRSRAE